MTDSDFVDERRNLGADLYPNGKQVQFFKNWSAEVAADCIYHHSRKAVPYMLRLVQIRRHSMVNIKIGVVIGRILRRLSPFPRYKRFKSATLN